LDVKCQHSLLGVLNVKLANMSSGITCIQPEVRLPLDQWISRSNCCEKNFMASPGSLPVFCTT